MGAEMRADGALLHKRVPQKDAATDQKTKNDIMNLKLFLIKSGTCLRCFV